MKEVDYKEYGAPCDSETMQAYDNAGFVIPQFTVVNHMGSDPSFEHHKLRELPFNLVAGASKIAIKRSLGVRLALVLPDYEAFPDVIWPATSVAGRYLSEVKTTRDKLLYTTGVDDINQKLWASMMPLAEGYEALVSSYARRRPVAQFMTRFTMRPLTEINAGFWHEGTPPELLPAAISLANEYPIIELVDTYGDLQA